MQRLLLSTLVVPALLLAWAVPANGQYRRQVEQLEPLFGVTASVGALLSYGESISPVETPELDEDRRAMREVPASPWVSLAARYGRGIALYAGVGAALAGDVEVQGADPLTGEPIDRVEDGGVIAIYSAGASFAPLRDVMGLRVEIGPSWMDLGTGGSYLAVRVAASAKFLEIGDRGGVLLAWDGYFAGGQHDRDEIEYQVRAGRMSGVRAGFEMMF